QTLARVSTAEPLREVLRTVVSGTVDALGCDAVTLYRYDPRTRTLLDQPTADGVWDEASLYAEDEKVADHFVQRVLRGEAMRVVPDVMQDEDFRETRFSREEKIASCVAVSLRVRAAGAAVGQAEQVVGVMFVNFRTPHHFSTEECANIRLFADQAAVAIHNAQLHEELGQAVAELQLLLKRVRAATALATFGIVDRQWRHNVSHFAPDVERWVRAWQRKLRQGHGDDTIPRGLADELDRSAEKFLQATLRRIGQRPVMVQPDEELEAVGVNELVLDAVKTWRAREGWIGLTLSARLEAADDDAVYINRVWMRAAISTLIDNAAKAVTGTPLRDVILGTRRVNGTVQIDFIDTGCGIPSDVLDEFGTAPRTTHPPGEGTGVGLLIAQSIAFTYEGQVEAFRRPDGEPGSVVRISLPVYLASVREPAAPVEAR
ncbi:MAG TPA: GAF domain-containing sensor histidine kinase, partial [Longimicrobium sp.]